jgi:hypothetical protein
VGIGVSVGIGESVGSGAGVGIGVIAGMGVITGLGVACAPSATNARRSGFISLLYPDVPPCHAEKVKSPRIWRAFL